MWLWRRQTTHFASSASAIVAAAMGADALVPVKVLIQPLLVVVVD